jgi:hypothetical protein
MVDRGSINNNNNNSFSSSSSFRAAAGPAGRGPAQGSSTKQKVIFFGDSFVRMFGLVEHRDLSVKAFKGASAKGLGRPDNENREQIVRMVQGSSTSNKSENQRLVFLFGSVDVHLSYYYKKYTLGEGEIDLEQIAYDYVDFCASLLPDVVQHNNSNNNHINQDQVTTTTTTVTIVGIYPSPLADEAVGLSLAAMGTIAEELIPIVAAADDSKLHYRQERVLRYNAALAKRCHEKGLDYIDAYHDVLDVPSNTIKDMYRDVSDYNIHIVWETTLLLWLEKLPWLHEYIAGDFADKLRQTLKDYLKTKPWAERTHVTQEGQEEDDDDER